MKNTTPWTSILLVIAGLAACGTNPDTPPAAQPDTTMQEKTARQWQIEYSVSGGIAGLQRQLAVDSSGTFSASDRKQGHAKGNLGAEKLARLEKALAGLEGAPAQRSGPAFPGRCADCIESRINAVIDGKRYAATFRSGDNPAQPYADLNAQLSTLLKEALSKQ